MLQFPVTKQFFLPLCTLQCSLVSEWVTRANFHLFISEISNFGAAMIFQVLHLFIPQIAKKIAIFFRLQSIPLYISRRKLGTSL